MIAIPNMEMPKTCWECKFREHWECILTGKAPTSTKRNRFCPLIEIDLVRCGECKHRDSEFCQIRESMYGIKDNDFCSYGERRNE